MTVTGGLNYETMDDIPLSELMKCIPGPDFPTAGIIVGRAEPLHRIRKHPLMRALWRPRLLKALDGEESEFVRPALTRALADALGASIHVRVSGENDHHKTEACFKAFGRALRQAIAVETNLAPPVSTGCNSSLRA